MDPTTSAAGHRFGLIANPTKPRARELALALRERFANHGWRPLVDDVTCALIGAGEAQDYECIGSEAELIVVLGGDGTILKTARLLGRNMKPLAAMNTGRLGFLTTGAEQDQERFVEAIVRGDYTLSRRRLIAVEFTANDGKTHNATALNEISITRGNLPRLIHLEARIDGEVFNRYSGDGLIVSTPTGSTAYSLSAGGPIVSPDAKVFVVTPICSHALANRSLVVGDFAALEFSAHGTHEDIVLTIDGGISEVLAPGTVVRARRADYDVPLVMLPGHNFYSLLQEKLGWKGTTLG
ncbi:MAG: NAD(+)/NADH kinase [Verrucomicrobiales bacterium]